MCPSSKMSIDYISKPKSNVGALATIALDEIISTPVAAMS